MKQARVILNKIAAGDPPAPSSPAEPALAGRLLDLARAVKARGLTAQGVRYGTHTDQALRELRRESTSLTGISPSRQLPSRSAALAFWINLYNAIVIHGAMHLRVQRSVKEIPRFFTRVAYDVGGQVFTLDTIEHGLLRQNRGHPRRLGLPQLLPGDPRRVLVLRPMDLRVHFALNCGAHSCPPIRHYTAANIEAELDLAARSFIGGGGVSVAAETNSVLLSRVFLWFARDFGWTRYRQLSTLLPYLDEPRRGLTEAAARNGIHYADYDWSFA